MSYVKFEVIEGIMREQKAALVADVTRSLADRFVSGRMVQQREDANAAVPSQ